VRLGIFDGLRHYFAAPEGFPAGGVGIGFKFVGA
jgi:hypothetical protein